MFLLFVIATLIYQCEWVWV